jgi:hypothetical protein
MATPKGQAFITCTQHRNEEISYGDSLPCVRSALKINYDLKINFHGAVDRDSTAPTLYWGIARAGPKPSRATIARNHKQDRSIVHTPKGGRLHFTLSDAETVRPL